MKVATPLDKRVARHTRKIEGRICLDISRHLGHEAREYIAHTYQGDVEAAYADILKPKPGFCEECGKACGHNDNDATRMRAVEAYFKTIGAMAPDVQVNIGARFGVESEAELRGAVTMQHMVQQLSEQEKLDSMAKRLVAAGYTVTRPAAPQITNGSSAEEVT